MMLLETRAVVRMYLREELGNGEGLVWVKAENLSSVLAALRQATARIALEGHHRPGGQRLLQ